MNQRCKFEALLQNTHMQIFSYFVVTDTNNNVGKRFMVFKAIDATKYFAALAYTFLITVIQKSNLCIFS